MSGVGLSHEVEIMFRKIGFPQDFMTALLTDATYAQLLKKMYKDGESFVQLPIQTEFSPVSFRFTNEDFVRMDGVLSSLGIDPNDFWGYVSRNESFARRITIALFTGDKTYKINVDKSQILDLVLTKFPYYSPDLEDIKDMQKAFFSISNEGINEVYSKDVVIFSNREEMSIQKMDTSIRRLGFLSEKPFEMVSLYMAFPDILHEKIISLGEKMKSPKDKKYEYYCCLNKENGKVDIDMLAELVPELTYRNIPTIVQPHRQFIASF